MAVRRNAITGEPIVFAPGRAGRPSVDDSSGCPFCPGNEQQTPPELTRLGELAPGPWTARVFRNKYPAVTGHEVIVESHVHDDTFDRLTNAVDVVRLYRDRYAAHRDAAYTSLFKNHGARAGATIPHIHSQLMPLPFVPSRIARESEAFARAATCPLCAPLEHIIHETEHFRWLAPHASFIAYQQWLVPKQHVADFAVFQEAQLADLAALLQLATRATRTIADAHNWSFVSFPRTPTAHFYVELFPRLTTVAGFELGTGTFIEIIDPAAAARRLQDAASS
ncbi:MAG TPA: hypothetical protein VF618_21235 [Thermoanaerobaculia bacterium]